MFQVYSLIHVVVECLDPTKPQNTKAQCVPSVHIGELQSRVLPGAATQGLLLGPMRCAHGV